MRFLFDLRQRGKINQSFEEKRLLFFLFEILFFALCSVTLIIPTFQGIQLEKNYRPGDIAVRDFIIKEDISVEDRLATDRKRKAELARLVAIYDYDDKKNEEVLTNIQNLMVKANLDQVSNDILSVEEKVLLRKLLKRINFKEILQLVREGYQHGVYQGELRRLGEASDRVILRKGAQNVEVELISLTSANELQTAIIVKAEQIAQLSSEEKELFRKLLKELLRPNIFFNQQLNQQALADVDKRVQTEKIHFKKGYALLRKGDQITPEKYYQLSLILERDSAQQKRKLDFYLIFTIVFFLFLILRSLLRGLQKKGLGDKRTFIVFASTLLLSIFLARFFLIVMALLLRDVSEVFGLNYSLYQIYYLIPFAFGPLLISFLYDFILGIVFSVFNAVFLTLFADFDFRAFLVFFTASVAINFAIEFYSRLKRSSLIKAATIFLLPVTIVMVTVFHVFDAHLTGLDMFVFFLFVAGSCLATAIFATFAVPVYEFIFRIVTELKLIELTNLNLPIFREMLEKAPGTYHHSQMVASLAEAAAAQLNLSSLWLRAMALYHDIGKIDQPQFFTENHTIYENPHLQIAPEQSARAITNHLTAGIERAERLKLPQKIQNAILTHHGTKKVHFFYEKAREINPDVQEDIFSYSGIKPQTIEDAIIMLADQVEAALKSLNAPKEQDIMNVIEKIINTNIEERQFDECEGLSFKILQIIARSFYQKLVSIYHQRIAYPGFNFKERQE